MATSPLEQESSYFNGLAAVITGGASGIGRATAEAFVAVGAYVIIVDSDATRLDATVGELKSATAVYGNISRWEDCLAVAQAARECGRPVRTLVNCAASFLAKSQDATSADWDLILGVNVKGAAQMTSAVVGVIRAAGGGAIVNVASISGYIAQPKRWTYNATKGAILSLTRCQALDLAQDNIRVNSVSPGTIWTPELDRMTNDDRVGWEAVFGAHHMLNRVGEPSEVASVILFLCGPGASFITGADILVDGGYVAMGHERLETRVPYTDS